MYRTILPIVLYLGTLSAAPQEAIDSDITYIKQDPLSSQPPIDITSPTQESHVENLDLIPGDVEPETTTVTFDSAETTDEPETIEPATEKPTQRHRTRPPFVSPRFLSKLSYFKKDYEAPSTNFIERTDKRRFRSKCRCEKIWNCPKLQISVPRCPNEYFLCCF